MHTHVDLSIPWPDLVNTITRLILVDHGVPVFPDFACTGYIIPFWAAISATRRTKTSPGNMVEQLS